jgi:hypothetical protein
MSRHSDRVGTWKKRGKVLWRDLGLLSSLYIARFIVWRTLRAERKERIVRLKKLRLIKRSTLEPRA